ncbi:MAG: hypothetical protein ABI647_17535, partial [Gemmatimonadota bacterium]
MTNRQAHALGLLALCCGLPWLGLFAQRSPLDRAAQRITEVGVRRTVMTIAADSMLGRDTPSRGLDLTADYVARAFREAGLEPGAAGDYIQRYPLARRRLDAAVSSIVLMSGPTPQVTLPLSRDAAYLNGTVPSRPVTSSLVVVGGNIDASRIPSDSLAGKIVLWLADFSDAGLAKADAIGTVLATSRAIAILMAPSDTSIVGGPAATQERERVEPEQPAGLSFLAVMVNEAAIARQDAALGAELRTIRAASETVVRGVPLRATIDLRDRPLGQITAPNVIGMIRGSDPALAGEVVVLSAHMDHLGFQSGLAPDS